MNGASAAAMLSLLPRVGREEAMTVERLGDAYREQAGRTGRLLLLPPARG